MTQQFDTGDVVRHGPCDEEWLIAYAEGPYVYPCGWPDSRALADDCALVTKASADVVMRLLREMAGGSGDDHRHRYARAKLAETEESTDD